MSVESLAIAMHHSRSQTPAQIAVLMGIANHDGDGGAWPTVNTLAHYARIQRRQVQRIVGELERLGEIRRDIQEGGTAGTNHYDRPNLYHFVLQCPPHCDHSKNHKLICQVCGDPMPKAFQLTPAHPKCAPAEGVSPATPGVTHDARGVSPVTPKPSLEPEPRLKEETHELNRAHAHEKDGSAASRYQAAIAAKNERQGRTPPASAVFDLAASLAAATAPREPEPIDFDPCPHFTSGPVPHSYSRKTGECIDCLAPDPDFIDPAKVNLETGEVA